MVPVHTFDGIPVLADTDGVLKRMDRAGDARCGCG